MTTIVFDNYWNTLLKKVGTPCTYFCVVVIPNLIGNIVYFTMHYMLTNHDEQEIEGEIIEQVDSYINFEDVHIWDDHTIIQLKTMRGQMSYIF